MKLKIHRGFEVLREEGLFVLIKETMLFIVSPIRRRYRKQKEKNKRIRKKINKLLINASIRTRWIIRYVLRGNFRYMVDNPVFVVGCGHSGTTVLLRIVGAHPNFHAILVESYPFRPVNLKNPDILSVANKLALLDLEAFRAGKKRWVEKTPVQIYHIDDILRIRPKAKILLIIRDGRDIAISIKSRTGDFESGVRRWINDNKAAEKWWNHKQVLVARYESLVEEFEDTVTGVMDFLGEEFSEQCYQYHQHYLDREEPLSMPGNKLGVDNIEYRKWQVQQPLFDGRNQWIDTMTNDEKILFKKLAGEMLVGYGYSKDSQW